MVRPHTNPAMAQALLVDRLMRRRTIWLLVIFAAALHGQTQEANRAMPSSLPPPYVALTAHQRLIVYLKDTVNPVSLLRSAASAGWGQWRNRPEEWGQGSHAFEKRIVSSYAEHITVTTLMYGASSLLHEDNRYLRSGETGAKARVRYALESSFLARHNDGTRHVSLSKIGAIVGAALISRTWQPESTRGLRPAAVNVGVMIGASAGFNVLREFLPDLLHRK
jgi:hypothetical protein